MSRNAPVGTCPCPVDSTHTCDVYRFNARAKTEAGRRKAGKFYIHCTSVHGVMGFAGNAWVQEHVLETITWAKDAAPPDSPPRSEGREAEGRAGQTPAPAPTAGPAAPSRAPATPAKAKEPARPKTRHWADLW